jgi:transposase
LGTTTETSHYLSYSRDRAQLLPSSVRDVLEFDQLCFFVHAMVERLNLSRYHKVYSAEGGELYHPLFLVKVWLGIYALDVTSTRRLERRFIEDLAFRGVAGAKNPAAPETAKSLCRP